MNIIECTPFGSVEKFIFYNYTKGSWSAAVFPRKMSKTVPKIDVGGVRSNAVPADAGASRETADKGSPSAPYFFNFITFYD